MTRQERERGIADLYRISEPDGLFCYTFFLGDRPEVNDLPGYQSCILPASPLDKRVITMDFDAYIRFANENPVTYIATVDGDQPRVRAFSLWFADKSGFYYHTGSRKTVCQQLKKNPKVELCFYKPGEAAGTMMRVTGKAEFLDDTALEERLLSDRAWLKDAVKNSPNGSKLAMFRIAHGEAWFWTMMDNMRESQVPRMRF